MALRGIVAVSVIAVALVLGACGEADRGAGPAPEARSDGNDGGAGGDSTVTGTTGSPDSVPPVVIDFDASEGITLSDAERTGLSFRDRDSGAVFVAYHPVNLFDGEMTTAWVEGAPGNGVGTTLDLRVQATADGPPRADAVRIAAGYFKPGLYEPNSRVKELTLSFYASSDASDPALVVSAELEDRQEVQEIDLGISIEFTRVTLTIAAVYPGSSYQDTAISELSFMAQGAVVEAMPPRPRLIQRGAGGYAFLQDSGITNDIMTTYGELYPYAVTLGDGGDAVVAYDLPELNPNIAPPDFSVSGRWEPAGPARFVITAPLLEGEPESELVLLFHDPFDYSLLDRVTGESVAIVPSVAVQALAQARDRASDAEREEQLIAAILADDAERVRAFLDEGFDPGSSRVDGEIPIPYTFTAAGAGSVAALQVLLEAGAPPEGVFAAVQGGHTEALVLLLEAGGDPTERFAYATTDDPLLVAIKNSALEIAGVLIEADAPVGGRHQEAADALSPEDTPDAGEIRALIEANYK